MIFWVGVVFLAVEAAVLVGIFSINPIFAGKILSMIGANHLGGRLACISVGLEFEISSFSIILILIAYNTTYLMLAYSVVVFFSERAKKFPIIRNSINSMQNKAQKTARIARKWNWVSIALYVWFPLPMTGAVMGSILSYLEGNKSKHTMLMVISSMWVGVVSWTLWFDRLYELIEKLGKNGTVFLTVFLVLSPFLYNGVRKLWRRLKAG
ncbi:small multi-drug export protein [bacterium]|nr:small multi-drug export protein [bacterium]